MRIWLVELIMLLCTPAFSQQQPPVVVFDSVPDPLKLPDNLYFVKSAASRSILMATFLLVRVATPLVRHTPPPRRRS